MHTNQACCLPKHSLHIDHDVCAASGWSCACYGLLAECSTQFSGVFAMPALATAWQLFPEVNLAGFCLLEHILQQLQVSQNHDMARTTFLHTSTLQV